MARYQIRSGGHGVAVVDADTDHQALLIWAMGLTCEGSCEIGFEEGGGAVLLLEGDQYTADRAASS